MSRSVIRPPKGQYHPLSIEQSLKLINKLMPTCACKSEKELRSVLDEIFHCGEIRLFMLGDDRDRATVGTGHIPGKIDHRNNKLVYKPPAGVKSSKGSDPITLITKKTPQELMNFCAQPEHPTLYHHNTQLAYGTVLTDTDVPDVEPRLNIISVDLDAFLTPDILIGKDYVPTWFGTSFTHKVFKSGAQTLKYTPDSFDSDCMGEAPKYLKPEGIMLFELVKQLAELGQPVSFHTTLPPSVANWLVGELAPDSSSNPIVSIFDRLPNELPMMHYPDRTLNLQEKNSIFGWFVLKDGNWSPTPMWNQFKKEAFNKFRLNYLLEKLFVFRPIDRPPGAIISEGALVDVVRSDWYLELCLRWGMEMDTEGLSPEALELLDYGKSRVESRTAFIDTAFACDGFVEDDALSHLDTDLGIPTPKGTISTYNGPVSPRQDVTSEHGGLFDTPSTSSPAEAGAGLFATPSTTSPAPEPTDQNPAVVTASLFVMTPSTKGSQQQMHSASRLGLSAAVHDHPSYVTTAATEPADSGAAHSSPALASNNLFEMTPSTDGQPTPQRSPHVPRQVVVLDGVLTKSPLAGPDSPAVQRRSPPKATTLIASPLASSPTPSPVSAPNASHIDQRSPVTDDTNTLAQADTSPEVQRIENSVLMPSPLASSPIPSPVSAPNVSQVDHLTPVKDDTVTSAKAEISPAPKPPEVRYVIPSPVEPSLTPSPAAPPSHSSPDKSEAVTPAQTETPRAYQLPESTGTPTPHASSPIPSPAHASQADPSSPVKNGSVTLAQAVASPVLARPEALAEVPSPTEQLPTQPQASPPTASPEHSLVENHAVTLAQAVASPPIQPEEGQYKTPSTFHSSAHTSSAPTAGSPTFATPLPRTIESHALAPNYTASPAVSAYLSVSESHDTTSCSTDVYALLQALTSSSNHSTASSTPLNSLTASSETDGDAMSGDKSAHSPETPTQTGETDLQLDDTAQQPAQTPMTSPDEKETSTITRPTPKQIFILTVSPKSTAQSREASLHNSPTPVPPTPASILVSPQITRTRHQLVFLNLSHSSPASTKTITPAGPTVARHFATNSEVTQASTRLVLSPLQPPQSATKQFRVLGIIRTPSPLKPSTRSLNLNRFKGLAFTGKPQGLSFKTKSLLAIGLVLSVYVALTPTVLTTLFAVSLPIAAATVCITLGCVSLLLLSSLTRYLTVKSRNPCHDMALGQPNSALRLNPITRPARVGISNPKPEASHSTTHQPRGLDK